MCEATIAVGAVLLGLLIWWLMAMLALDDAQKAYIERLRGEVRRYQEISTTRGLEDAQKD